jgi:hypothetical protein
VNEWRQIILNALWIVPVCVLAVYLLAKYVIPSTSDRPLPPAEQHDIGTAKTGDRFVLPNGWTIKALDDVVLQLPGELLADNEKIGDVIHGHDDMGFRAEFDETTGRTAAIFVRLSSGQDFSLSKSCEAVIHAEDRTVRIQILSRGEP